jgi:hypothetical protein
MSAFMAHRNQERVLIDHIRNSATIQGMAKAYSLDIGSERSMKRIFFAMICIACLSGCASTTTISGDEFVRRIEISRKPAKVYFDSYYVRRSFTGAYYYADHYVMGEMDFMASNGRIRTPAKSLTAEQSGIIRREIQSRRNYKPPISAVILMEH